ncbi:hypothetical protein [Pseudomonas sp. DG56-2]|uniref:hypothetical protein n=1 Tax=Pseudomonas sp. DG56-2 TaxID=2320270 RepID=UPI0010A60C54|nr:hypothetical protein [Pseudomonas sp. DG56-2]
MNATVSSQEHLAHAILMPFGSQATTLDAGNLSARLDNIGKGVASIMALRQPLQAGQTSVDAQASANVAAKAKNLVSSLRSIMHDLLPTLGTPLDDFLAQASKPGALRDQLKQSLHSSGFSAEEVEWAFGELDSIEFRLVDLLVNNNPRNLDLLLDGISTGQNGLHNAGFLAFSGDAEIDQALTSLITRCREKGVTASYVHVLVLAFGAAAAVNHYQTAENLMFPHVAWTPHALTQLHALHLTQAGQTFVINHTNNWVTGAANGWALNTNHNTHDITTGLTVTARVVAIAGPNRTVNIMSIQ